MSGDDCEYASHSRGDTVKVNFNVKYKFKVNGKEYNSPEEMPDSIRAAYEKAVAEQGGNEKGNIPSVTSGKITFNGQDYPGIDAMPPDVRQLYETVMKTVSEGKVSVTGNVDFKFGKKAENVINEGAPEFYSLSKPVVPQSFFSPVVLVLLGIIMALIAGLYFYTH